jgi:hypothetical protein
MDDLGHEDAAALGGPATPPRFGVVLRVAVEPGHDPAGDRRTEPTIVDRVADAPGRGPEATLEQHAEPHPGGRGRGDHPVGLFDPQGDGFLAQDVRTVPGRRQHSGFVGTVWCTDRDGVQAGGQHPIDIAVGARDLVLCGEHSRPVHLGVGDGDHLDTGHGPQGADVVPRYLAAAGDSYAHRVLPVFRLGRRATP